MDVALLCVTQKGIYTDMCTLGSMRGMMTELRPSPKLSAREIRVLECRVRGLSYKEVAAELDISIDTVKQYVTRILRKTRTKTTAAAAFSVLKDQPFMLCGSGFVLQITVLPAVKKAA